MRVSTKGRYALRMMIEFGLNPDQCTKISQVAARQGISDKYLEQIVPVLNKSEMLQTNRGFQGGYRLAKTPDAYTVGEILRLTEGNLAPVACLADDPNQCLRREECITLPVWEGLYRAIVEYLDSITLQDILEGRKSGLSEEDV